MASWSSASGWNAAHRLLLAGRWNAKDRLRHLDGNIEQAEIELKELVSQRTTYLKTIADCDEVIDSWDFDCPPGYNQYGEAI